MTKQGKTILIIAIVGACCVGGVMVLLILAAIAIPAMQSAIRHGNETAAIAAMRLFVTEEDNYNMMYADRGYSCSLAALGGTPQSGPPTADAAQLVPADLSTGHKAGYTFAFSNCVTQKGRVTSYKLTAVPDRVGHTGQRGFCTDEDGAIKFDPAGGANCTEPLQ